MLTYPYLSIRQTTRVLAPYKFKCHIIMSYPHNIIHSSIPLSFQSLPSHLFPLHRSQHLPPLLHISELQEPYALPRPSSQLPIRYRYTNARAYEWGLNMCLSLWISQRTIISALRPRVHIPAYHHYPPHHAYKPLSQLQKPIALASIPQSLTRQWLCNNNVQLPFFCSARRGITYLYLQPQSCPTRPTYQLSHHRPSSHSSSVRSSYAGRINVTVRILYCQFEGGRRRQNRWQDGTHGREREEWWVVVSRSLTWLFCVFIGKGDGDGGGGGKRSGVERG